MPLSSIPASVPRSGLSNLSLLVHGVQGVGTNKGLSNPPVLYLWQVSNAQIGIHHLHQGKDTACGYRGDPVSIADVAG